MSKEVIEAYAGSSDKLAMAVRGLSKEDLAWEPPADAKVGNWSIQQIIVHMADSEAVHADRMKRVIAEENPTLVAFDEARWAANLAYEQRSVEDSLALFTLVRKDMTVILRSLPPAAWQQAGMHTERGKLTLAQLVHGSNKHLDHHLEFIHAKRRLMGKEMW